MILWGPRNQLPYNNWRDFVVANLPINRYTECPAMIVGTPNKTVTVRAVLAFDALGVGAHHAVGRVPFNVDQIQEISG